MMDTILVQMILTQVEFDITSDSIRLEALYQYNLSSGSKYRLFSVFTNEFTTRIAIDRLVSMQENRIIAIVRQENSVKYKAFRR